MHFRMFSERPEAFKDTASLVATLNVNTLLRVEKQEYQKACLLLSYL